MSLTRTNMVQTRSKGKGKASVPDDLAMDDNEMFRLVDQTDILNGAAANINGSQAFKIMRPSELDAQQTTPTSSSSSSLPVPAKKLVELIDGEEAETTDPGSDEDEQEAIPGSPFEDESFQMLLCVIVFSTLWLCL